MAASFFLFSPKAVHNLSQSVHTGTENCPLQSGLVPAHHPLSHFRTSKLQKGSRPFQSSIIMVLYHFFRPRTDDGRTVEAERESGRGPQQTLFFFLALADKKKLPSILFLLVVIFLAPRTLFGLLGFQYPSWGG